MTEDMVMQCLQELLGPIEVQRLIKQAHEDIPMVKLSYRLSPTKDKAEQLRRRQAARRRRHERDQIRKCCPAGCGHA